MEGGKVGTFYVETFWICRSKMPVQRETCAFTSLQKPQQLLRASIACVGTEETSVDGYLGDNPGVEVSLVDT